MSTSSYYSKKSEEDLEAIVKIINQTIKRQKQSDVEAYCLLWIGAIVLILSFTIIHIVLFVICLKRAEKKAAAKMEISKSLSSLV